MELGQVAVISVLPVQALHQVLTYATVFVFIRTVLEGERFLKDGIIIYQMDMTFPSLKRVYHLHPTACYITQ